MYFVHVIHSELQGYANVIADHSIYRVLFLYRLVAVILGSGPSSCPTFPDETFSPHNGQWAPNQPR